MKRRGPLLAESAGSMISNRSYPKTGINCFGRGTIFFGVILCGFLTACVGQSSNIDTASAFADLQKAEPAATKAEATNKEKATLQLAENRATSLMQYASADKTVAEQAFPRGGGHLKIGRPYQISGQWYYPELREDYSETGSASWYGIPFHGQKTANGEVYDMNQLTAAHRTMPLPSYARVTNLTNGSSIIVRVNDRGPFAKNRIIDLSYKAAELLGYQKRGVTDVRVEYIGPAPLEGDDGHYLLSSYMTGKEKTPHLLSAAPTAKNNDAINKMIAASGSNSEDLPVVATGYGQ